MSGRCARGAWEHVDAIVAAALLAAHVATIFGTAVLPGHDLAQHAAIARVLADQRAGVASDVFAAAPGLQPYAIVHHALAALARASSIDLAQRAVLAAYAVALPASVGALVAAVDGERARAARACAVATTAIWNPVALMGFLPCALALPPFFAGLACVVRAERAPRRGAWGAGAAACGAALVSLHVVVAAAFVAMSALIALARRSRSALVASAAGIAGVAGALAAWSARGAAPLARAPWAALWSAARREGPLAGALDTFRVTFSPPAGRAYLAVSTVLGALPAPLKAVSAAALIAIVGSALAARRASAPRARAPGASHFRVAALAFVACVALAPTAIQVPNDVCLLDLRLYVLAGGVALAAIGLRAFDARGPRVALLGAATLVSLLWCRQVLAFGREAAPAVRLVDRLARADVLLALAFHDTSACFDEKNALTHYLPVYHTARNGGVTSTFWGGFTAQLPVAYREGREPPHPPDWQPWRVAPEDVEGATAVLVELPDEDDSAEAALGARRVDAMVGRALREVAADGRWRLYAVTAPSRALSAR